MVGDEKVQVVPDDNGGFATKFQVDITRLVQGHHSVEAVQRVRKGDDLVDASVFVFAHSDLAEQSGKNQR